MVCVRDKPAKIVACCVCACQMDCRLVRLGTNLCVRSHVYSYLCPGSDVAAEVCSASGAPACVPLRLPKNAGALRSSWVSYVVGCACSTCFNIAWLAIL